MEDSGIPTKIPVVWASSPDAGTFRVVPTAPPAQNGAASLEKGFPGATIVPIAAGGSWPFAQDTNGILNLVTAWLQWDQAGGPMVYDAAFSTAIGGYPRGATLYAAAGGFSWISLVDNNTSDPDTGGANWFKDGPYLPLVGGTLAGPGNLVVDGTLNVTGTLSTNIIDASAINAVSVGTSGNVVAGGQLVVTGAATLEDGLTVTGNVAATGDVLSNNGIFGSTSASIVNLGGNTVQIVNAAFTGLNTLNLAQGTSGNEAVSIAQFGFSTGGVGRFPIGGGSSFIVEWGTFNINSGGTIQDFNFAATFPNECLAIIACYQGVAPPTTGAVGVQPVNTVGFAAIDTSPAGGNHGCNYIALGF